jgi:hypothetical protein
MAAGGEGSRGLQYAAVTSSLDQPGVVNRLARVGADQAGPGSSAVRALPSGKLDLGLVRRSSQTERCGDRPIASRAAQALTQFR